MSKQNSGRLGVVQNLGWIDRVVRYIVGTALVAVPLTIIGMNIPMWTEGASVSGWLYVVMLIALYPFWTATVGWDPVYGLLNVRSCGGTETNPCGTLPYELDAAARRQPIPESDYQHNLATAHHRSDEQGRQRSNRGHQGQPGHAPG